MPLPGKIVKEAFGSLGEEVASKASRETYTQTLQKKVNEIDVGQKPSVIDDQVEQVLDTPQTEDFINIRESDIKREKSQVYLQGKKLDEEIADYTEAGVEIDTNFDGRLQGLQQKRQELYIKANNKKKELDATEHLHSLINDGQSPYEAMYDVLSSQVGKGKAFTNMEARTTATYNRVASGMTELKDKMRTKWAGMSQDLEFHADVIRYLKDGQVKDKARLAEVKQVADEWTTSANKVKSLRAKAGSKIGDLEDWVLPQSHDAMKMRGAKYKKWKKTILPKLDVERIETEQGTDIETILQSAYKNITTPKVETKGGVSSAIVNRGKESRVLHFKTGDDIVEYNKEFGNPDVFATMDNHIRSQSEEISQMQMFGGNPDDVYGKLKEIARANGMGSFQEGKLDALWKGVSGKSNGDNIIDTADKTIANWFGGYRAIMIGSKLGSAMVSALSDLGNIFLGAGYRDLSSIKMFGRGIEGLLQEAVGGKTTGANLKLANRIGVVSEFANASLANSRFADSVGAGFAQKSAEVVIRSSGLGSYTESMQAAFGLELAANIAENFGKKLDDVPFSRMLKEYGIDDAAWDTIRNSGAIHKIKDAEFFDVTKLYDVDEELGYRVSDMITNEMNAFVIMPGQRTKVYTTGGTQKGSLSGEAVRTVTMFKSFPISVVMMHLNRMSSMNGLGKTAYAGKAMGTGLVMGSITLWAYDTVTGKTARSADRPQMIGEALTKSGGLGIFGDFFIGMTENKYGHSFSDTLMGAAPSAIDDVINSASDLMHKDTDQAVGNIYKRATNYIPGQNLWYTRAIIERTIGDWVGDVVDPEHQKKKRRRQKAMNLRDQELLFN